MKAAPGCIDPRYRTAVDLYNRSIAEGLTSSDGAEVMLRAGAYKLPFGTLNLYLNEKNSSGASTVWYTSNRLQSWGCGDSAIATAGPASARR